MKKNDFRVLRHIPPDVSGVYKILCVPNGKIYIGSSVNIRVRFFYHRNTLRKQTHRNQYLQKAWNKYGENNFEFSILELADEHSLLSVEQKWIDETNCTNRKTGFNITTTAGSIGETLARKWHGFVDPQGNDVTIYNLEKFCRENNLNGGSLRRLAPGNSKLKSYKGWTHKNSIRKRDYVKTYDGFITPNGMLAGSITNLAAFCREHGLDNTHMVAVVNGRILSHRGWTYKDSRKKMDCKTYKGFINPQGQRVTITNLAGFCRENNLKYVRMHNLISGKRKSHKGWIWRDNYE